jgi:uncharacterized membrane protein
MPFRRPSPQILLFGFILLIVIVMIQIEVITLVLTKLGLSASSASLLLITTFIGSTINLPLARIGSNFVYDETNPLHQSILPYRFIDGSTLLAVNVGGGLIPILFSSYLLTSAQISLTAIILATTIISVISYLFSRPIANLGIGMPIFIAPVGAAIMAMMLSQENAPALAYISGSLGVLIGADILRIKDIRQLNAPIAAIGGAGTFDGIFMTGIIAVLLTH